MKKINIFMGGEYLCSTTQAKTCKQAVKQIMTKVLLGSDLRVWLPVAGKGDVLITGKLTAHFAK